MKAHLKTLTFFEQKQLIKDANYMKEKFQGYMDAMKMQIAAQKEFSSLTSIGKVMMNH